MPTSRLTPIGCVLLAACAQPAERAPATLPDTVVVYSASSLASPLRAVLDSFARATHATVQQENGASLELARRVTDLHRVPDVIALADEEVFPQLLMPEVTTWYARFARNRMVIAFTDRSRNANSATADHWRAILLDPAVRLGRTDPALAPAGYRTLLVYQLAERFYRDPGLAARLEARTAPGLMRANASELAALLSAGELDYIIDYESVARANHFRVLALPAEIDLGDPSRATAYGAVSVEVAQRGSSVRRAGAPIVYAASVPRTAPHHDAGVRLMVFLLGPIGRAILRAHALDALEASELVGDHVPPALTRAHVP